MISGNAAAPAAAMISAIGADLSRNILERILLIISTASPASAGAAHDVLRRPLAIPNRHNLFGAAPNIKLRTVPAVFKQFMRALDRRELGFEVNDAAL